MDRSAFDPSDQNQHTESKIIASLERISQAFRVLLWQESKELSLSPIQVQVLIFLLYHDRDKRKVTYLADEFSMTKATISDTVKTLELKGLISKEYEAHDNRSYVIHLSEKGRETAEKTALFARELQTPLRKLSPDHRARLLLDLKGIILHLHQAGIITIQRMCQTCAYYETSSDHHSHYCRLLNQPLQETELRIDCPEHQALGTGVS